MRVSLPLVSILLFSQLSLGGSNIQATPDLCPSWAPKEGQNACNPAEVAQELNRMPHSIDWTGNADSQWLEMHSHCSATESADQLGQAISDYVGRDFLGYWTGGTFARLREATPGLWQKRKALIEGFFKSSVNDPEIQAACCFKDTDCIRRFKEVKLIIGGDTEPEDSLRSGAGEYIPEKHAVYVGKHTLLSGGMFNYDEIIQGRILHELGHACDQAIFYSENPSAPIKVDARQPVEKEIAHIKSRLGDSFYSCLSQASSNDPGFLRGQLTTQTQPAQEAFAEAIFSFKYTQTLQWVSLKSYGGYQWAAHCALQDQKIKKSVCSDVTAAQQAIKSSELARDDLKQAFETKPLCNK